jgi:hypothetical protein
MIKKTGVPAIDKVAEAIDRDAKTLEEHRKSVSELLSIHKQLEKKPKPKA